MSKKLEIKIKNIEYSHQDFGVEDNDSWKKLIAGIDTDFNKIVRDGIYEMLQERILLFHNLKENRGKEWTTRTINLK